MYSRWFGTILRVTHTGHFLIAAWVGFISVAAAVGGDSLGIEQSQRELQARYALFNSGYLHWPDCACGPAPSYPKDGFYGDIIHDRKLGATLVSDLASKFYADYGGATLYSHFLNTPDGNLQGLVNVPAVYDAAAFPLPAISESNYLECLATLQAYIRKLVAVQVTCSTIGAEGDSGKTWREGGCINYDWNVVLTTAPANWTASGWHSDPPAFNQNPEALTGVGVRVVKDGGSVAKLFLQNIRGRISASAPYSSGAGKFYVKIAAFPGGFSNLPAGLTGTSGFQLLESFGAGGAYPSALLAGDMPTFSTDRTTSETGWQLVEAVAVFRPDFDVQPDPVECGGSCVTGGCSSVPGGVELSTPYPGFSISLGRSTQERSAGYLFLAEELPSDQLSTPASLRFAETSDVTNYPVTGALSQILAPQTLVKITTDNATQYTIRLYRRTDSDNYQPYSDNSPTTELIVQVCVRQLNGTANQLEVTETRGTHSITTQFAYDPGQGQWTRTAPDGRGTVRTDLYRVTWNSAHTSRTNSLQVLDSVLGPVYQQTDQHQTYPWGIEHVQRTVGTGPSALTSSWVYYDSPGDGASYGRLKEATEPTGQWQRYIYDGSGRLYKVVSQFGNAASGSAENASRVTTYQYSTSTPQVTILESLLDQEVGRTSTVFGSDYQQEIRCLTANYTDAANPKTTTTYDYSYYPPRPIQVTNPDGTMQFYTYTPNGVGKTNVTVASGEPNSNHTGILNGTTTTTVRDTFGQTLSLETKAIVNGSPSTILSSEIWTPDPFGRPASISYRDGTVESFTYACCGVETTTSRDGVTTTYGYDDLKRRYQEIVPVDDTHAISTITTLDAAGNVRQVTRVGTDNSNQMLRSATYDTAGRIATEANALQGTTTIVYNTPTTRAETYPDGGTRTRFYNQDGTLERVAGTATAPVRYEYGVETGNQYTKEIKLAADGTDTAEWTKSYVDKLGRPWKIVYPDSASQESFYNDLGQLWKAHDPDQVWTQFQHNKKGELEYTVAPLAVPPAAYQELTTADFQGSGRITRTETLPSSRDGYDVQRTTIYIWPTAGQNASLAVSQTETSLNAVNQTITWETVWRDTGTPVTTKTQTDYQRASHQRIVTVTRPDQTATVSTYLYGRLGSVANKDRNNNVLTQTIYDYDAQGRILHATDYRNGATTFGYNAADQVTSVTTPPPAVGSPAQITVTEYDSLGRPWRITQPDGAIVINEYWPSGALKKTSGPRTYPVSYVYDAQERLQTMTTWRNAQDPNTAAVTTWNYHPQRGWLSSKSYPGAAGPSYTYTLGGRLQTRTWARGPVTTYQYNNGGDLSTVTYSSDPQNTPSSTFTYDRRGRLWTVARNGISTTLAYNDINQLLSESYAGGTLDGFTVTTGYDTLLRRYSLSLNTQPSALNHSFTYDPVTGRLATIGDGANNQAVYSYVDRSDLVEHITFQQNGQTRMTTTQTYDAINRLTDVAAALPASPVTSAHYRYNAANQRDRLTLADRSYWAYEYDILGQVRAGKKHWPDDALVPGQQFEYTHDDIGNRTGPNGTKTGGDQSGGGLRSASYTPNALNQYGSRTVPNQLDVTGIANASANVTLTVNINGQNAAAYRHNEYFQASGTADNAYGPAWVPVTVSATRNGQTVQQPSTPPGHLLVAPATQSFGYDGDGNLLSDGLWNYTWDAENRLIAMDGLVSGPTARHLTFEYDCQGRRMTKVVKDAGWNTLTDTRFLYEGWNLVAEVNAQRTLVRSYLWGLDLSGAFQGAGGVGGLLAVTDAAQGAHFVAYDGNGNVTALLKASDSSTTAQYEYGRFGEPIRVSGSMGKSNPFRWSTKYTDDETDLVYYGYRYYSASLGRWISRDPSGEQGGVSLYGHVHNNPTDMFDSLGLDWRLVNGTGLQVQGPLGYLTGDSMLENIGAGIYNAFPLVVNASTRAVSTVLYTGLAKPIVVMTDVAKEKGEVLLDRLDMPEYKPMVGPGLGAITFIVLPEGKVATIGKVEESLASVGKIESACAKTVPRITGSLSEIEPAGVAAILDRTGKLRLVSPILEQVGEAAATRATQLEFQFTSPVEQYALRAKDSGFYPVLMRGSAQPQFITYLKKGDVWKFGTTATPGRRYSASYLKSVGEHGVNYFPEFQGSEKQARELQNMKIVNYLLQRGKLPPGNKIIN